MRLTRALSISLLLCLAIQVPAQNGARAPISEMRSAIERYTVDRGSLSAFVSGGSVATASRAIQKFYDEWMNSLKSLDFDSMSQDGKIDYILFKNHLEYDSDKLTFNRAS